MKAPSPLTGKYLVKNFYLFLFLKVIDFATSFFNISKKIKAPDNPQKILLSNIAHLGDAVVAASVLPVLKEKFPQSKIGFLCSTASKEILKHHPMIDKIHVFDHWKLNRSDSSIFNKLFEHFITRAKAFNEIRKEKYDAAIDLYSYFPNTIYLFWKAKIKTRIAYTSAGFENFLTIGLDWKNQDKHMSLYHCDLIRLLGAEEKKSRSLNADFSIFAEKKPSIDLPGEYVLFHVGAGDTKKMWDLNKWKQLTGILIEKGRNIVFTGKGIFENKQIMEILDYQKKCLNLCDKLDLREMIFVIKNAGFVVCADSVVSHMAAALNRPTAVIFCGINNYHHWSPNKKNVFPIVKKLACSPCYDKNGCETMDCLNTLQVDDVLSVMEKNFEKDN